MKSHFPKIDSLTAISGEDREIATAILSKLPSEVAQSWHDQVELKEGRVAGTYLGDVVRVLSYSDFVDLYTALGYEFPKPRWLGFKCTTNYATGVSLCDENPPYSCDPAICH